MLLYSSRLGAIDVENLSKAERSLNVKRFATSTQCIAALKAKNIDIWATDLSQTAIPLAAVSSITRKALNLPRKFALVVGREADGVSAEFLNAASRRIYIPMSGFGEVWSFLVCV